MCVSEVSSCINTVTILLKHSPFRKPELLQNKKVMVASSQTLVAKDAQEMVWVRRAGLGLSPHTTDWYLPVTSSSSASVWSASTV